jgi:hypothetical protein
VALQGSKGKKGTMSSSSEIERAMGAARIHTAVVRRRDPGEENDLDLEREYEPDLDLEGDLEYERDLDLDPSSINDPLPSLDKPLPLLLSLPSSLSSSPLNPVSPALVPLPTASPNPSSSSSRSKSGGLLPPPSEDRRRLGGGDRERDGDGDRRREGS